MPNPNIAAWSRFHEEVLAAEKALGSPPTVWYRGVPDVSFKLTPSLGRFKNGLANERRLYETYDQWTRGIADRSDGTESRLARRRNDWDILFEMQHFGIPTRLLDWTEVFGIAVFFALFSGDHNGKDAAVFVLNPFRLNVKTGKDDLCGQWDMDSFSYRQVYWDGKPLRPVLPLAFNPGHDIRRLHAQRGRFTVHGFNSDPLESLAGDCVKKVVLRNSAKNGAREFLKMAGIDELSLFPDIYGAARFIKSIVGLS